MRRVRTSMLVAAALWAPLGLTGCLNPFSMGVATPIPVPAWVTERMQEKYEHKNDKRTPIMPPIREGSPVPICEDPPDDAMVLRAMPHIIRGVPYIAEEHRDEIEIVKELIVDRMDPVRGFPLVGPGNLHHCHYRCTIYFTETVESGYPFPFRIKRPRSIVIYVDKDHLHAAGACSPEAQQSITNDLSGF